MRTEFIAAAKNGDEGRCRDLISQGVDVNSADEVSDTLKHTCLPVCVTEALFSLSIACVCSQVNMCLSFLYVYT